MEKANLIKLRHKAMRAGVWFRRLQRIDRLLIDLTIRVAKSKINGTSLINQLMKIVSKLESFLESELSMITRDFGLPIANKISFFAQKWGNKAAEAWVKDLEFARFLAVMHINNTIMAIRI